MAIRPAPPRNADGPAIWGQLGWQQRPQLAVTRTAHYTKRMRATWSGWLGAAVLAVLSSFALPLAADGMSCGNRLISKGDSLYQVRSLCGEPDDARRRIETRTERRRVRVPCEHGGGTQCERTVEHTTDVVVDEWTYDFGRRKFLRFLTFVDGRLMAIHTGGYGSRDDR